MNLKKWKIVEFTFDMLVVIGLIFLIFWSTKSDGRKVPYPQPDLTQSQVEENFRDYCRANGGRLSSFRSQVNRDLLVLQCGKLGKLELPLIPYYEG